jgi:hypothetical protein
MEIFKALGEEGVEFAHPVDAKDFEALNLAINGRPQLPTWSPIRMKIVRVDEGRRLRETDSPWLGGHALILRRRAVEAILPLLHGNGEVLPLACADELYVFNPTNLIDCLDDEKSDLVRFKDGNAIMRISKHVFRRERIVGVDAFKIPNLRVSPLFVTDAFVEKWKAAGLTGVEWQVVP